MAQSRGAQRPMPGEILDSIVDLLSLDWRSLAACFLTSSALSPRARHHTSRSITLLLGVNQNADARDFMRIFHPGSPLADLPTALDIRGRDDFQVFFPDAFLQLAHLRHVRALKLSLFDILSIAKLRSLYLSLPRLEELQIYGLVRQAYHITEDILAGDPRNQASHPLAPATGGALSLKSLRIGFNTRDNGVNESSSIRTALLGDLDAARSSSTSSLATFSYMCPPWHILPGWASVIANSVESLRELRVCLRYPVLPDEDEAFYASIYRCKALRKLTLVTPPHERFPEYLHKCLAAQVPRFASRPLPAFAPTLQELRLAIGGRIDDSFFTAGGSEVLTDLARALLPRTYPALTDVRVVYHIPSATISKAKQDVAGHMLRALQSLRIAGVRVDVQIKPPPAAGRLHYEYYDFLEEECV